MITLALSSCRPAIDDNLADSESAANIKDGSISPDKLSQAYLPLAGGTLSGSLTLSGAPTESLHAATKAYVDSLSSTTTTNINSLSSSTTTQLTLASPPGAVSAFAGSSAPNGWLLCDGSAVSRTTYSSLFTAIGTTWGAGNGTTTFNLPDFRGMFLRGTGTHGTAAKANATTVAGPSLGAIQNDQFQGHTYSITGYYTDVNNGSGTIAAGNNWGGSRGEHYSVNRQNDGTNGSPRTGDETRPFNYGVNYIIKY